MIYKVEVNDDNKICAIGSKGSNIEFDTSIYTMPMNAYIYDANTDSFIYDVNYTEPAAPEVCPTCGGSGYIN